MSWAPVVWIFGVKGFGQPANLNVLIWVIKIETSKVSIETNTASLSENKQKNPVTYLFNQNQVNWCMDGKALQKLPFFFSEIHGVVFLPHCVNYSRNEGKADHQIIFDST